MVQLARRTAEQVVHNARSLFEILDAFYRIAARPRESICPINNILRDNGRIWGIICADGEEDDPEGRET